MYQSIFYNYRTSTCYLRDDNLGWQDFPYRRTFYKPDPNGKHLTLDGKRVSPTEKCAKEDLSAYEKDVDMNLRVLLDLYVDDDSPAEYHNRLFLDIETEVGEAINLDYCQRAPSKITGVSIYDATAKEYTAFVLDEQKSLKESTKGDVHIVPCSNEVNLLMKVLDKWKEIDPTIVVGWNSDNFDIPYMYNRMRRILGEFKANELSPLGIVYFDEYNQYKMPYRIAGVNCLDYMLLYKKFIPKQQPSYSLGAIGEAEVNRGKVMYEGSLDNLFRTDIDKFIEYNVGDVRIIVELDQKKKFLDLAIMVCHMAHVPYQYVYESSRVIEGAIMTYLRRKGIVSPNKPTTMHPELKVMEIGKDDEDEDKFAGAYVKIPIPGLYGWNCDLDLESLYPSLGIQLNLGIETFLFKIVQDDKFDDSWNLADMKEKDDCEIQIEDLDGKYKTTRLSKIIKFIEGNDVLIAPNGVAFDSKKESVLAEVMNHWFKKRKEFKTMMIDFGKKGDKEKYELYDRYQQVMKVFLNSIYGVLGLKSFRYSDGKDHLASAITAAGRLTVMRSADWTNDKIHDEYEPESEEVHDYVLMSDTDSMYIDSTGILRYHGIDPNDDDKVVECLRNTFGFLASELNHFYIQFSKDRFNCRNNRLKTKSETTGRKIYISAKKQYAQLIIDKEGVKMEGDDRFDFKGLDFMKSSFPKLFRVFTQNIIKDILTDKDKNYIDEKILEFRETYKTLPLVETAKPTGINKMKEYMGARSKGNQIFTPVLKRCPVNTKAAIYYNDLLKYKKLDKNHSIIQIGDKMKWMYLKDNPYKIPVLGFNSYDCPKDILEYIETYMDREKMFNSMLVNKLEKIYENLTWGQINFNKNTKKFFSFN